MVLTALELKDKTFGTKFRGYSADEVDDFLDIVTRDYEELIQKTHDQDAELKALRERLAYFDEMKESLSKSVILAQDTAEKVKQAAEHKAENIVNQANYDAAALLQEAKQKANEILRTATDSAKKVVIETEELKNKTRIFHQRLKSSVESQLSLVNSSEWEEILRPTATYIQTSDDAFREVLHLALEEEVSAEEYNLDYTRQMTAEELAELKKHARVFDGQEAEDAEE